MKNKPANTAATFPPAPNRATDTKKQFKAKTEAYLAAMQGNIIAQNAVMAKASKEGE